jgi:hypothetical protein
VEITTVVDPDAKTVTIGYTSDEGMVRAFALDIVATGGNIIAISGYTAGDDNGTYGIFPGSFDDVIVVDPCGVVSNWGDAGYTPVAPSDDTDALGPIGGSQITIEMGSLYPDGGNAPPELSGDLCTITVDGDVTEVCITANAIRGNVVLEDANEPETLVVPDIPGDTCAKMDEDVPCFPSTFTTYGDWVTYGKPECWCGPPYTDGYQCLGDADGVTEGWQKYRVYSQDLIAMSTDWGVKIGAVTNPCADFDHKAEGWQKYRVYSQDLILLSTNWGQKDSEIGVPGTCGTPANPE